MRNVDIVARPVGVYETVLTTGESIVLPADGVLSDDAVKVFSLGQCAGLAVAVSEILGTGMVAMIYSDGSDMPYHVYAVSADGESFYDVNGVSLREDVEYYIYSGAAADDYEDYDGLSVIVLPVGEFLEEWLGCFPPQNFPLAREWAGNGNYSQ